MQFLHKWGKEEREKALKARGDFVCKYLAVKKISFKIIN